MKKMPKKTDFKRSYGNLQCGNSPLSQTFLSVTAFLTSLLCFYHILWYQMSLQTHNCLYECIQPLLIFLKPITVLFYWIFYHIPLTYAKTVSSFTQVIKMLLGTLLQPLMHYITVLSLHLMAMICGAKMLFHEKVSFAQIFCVLSDIHLKLHYLIIWCFYKKLVWKNKNDEMKMKI